MDQNRITDLNTLLQQSNVNHSVHLSPHLRPVLLALPLPLLHDVGDHHHHPHPLVPDQSPELGQGGGKWTLDNRLLVIVTDKEWELWAQWGPFVTNF